MTRPGPCPHRFGRAELARLWLSYQRYALLCFAIAGGLVAAGAAWAPESWLTWALLAAPVAALTAFGVSVYARFPRKLRATALAERRIQSGRFGPNRLRGYCDDPCFRVVAGEILARAGYARRERRRLIGELARESHAPIFLLEVDHAQASVRVDGDEVGTLSSTPGTEGERG